MIRHHLRTGQVAVAHGYVSAAQLEAALRDWQPGSGTSLCEALTTGGLISNVQAVVIDKLAAAARAEPLAAPTPSLQLRFDALLSEAGADLPGPASGDETTVGPPAIPAAPGDETDPGIPPADDDDDNRSGRRALRAGEDFARCEVLGLVGSGGMGTIYRGRHRILDSTLAIKLLAPSLTRDATIVERFLQEARAAARLDHPSIVRIHDVGEDAGRYYILMEYVEGKDLAGMVREEGALSPADSLYIVRAVAEGLAAAHDAGIVHRDIKPDNVLVDGARIKVTDFGLAKLIGQGTPAQASEHILGSPYFVAPEQAHREHVDARADLYSLGATWYYMVTGRYPHEGSNALEVMFKHGREAVVPPAVHNPALPPSVDRLILRLMAAQRSHRPASTHVLIDMLDTIDLSQRSRFEQIAQRTGSARLTSAGSNPAIPTHTLRENRKSVSARRRRTSSSQLIVRRPVSSTFNVRIDPDADDSSADNPATVSGEPDTRALHEPPVRHVPETTAPLPARLSPEELALLEASARDVESMLTDGRIDEAQAHLAKALRRFPGQPPLPELKARADEMAASEDAVRLLEGARAALTNNDGPAARRAIDGLLAHRPDHAEALALREELEKRLAGVQGAVQRGLELVRHRRLDEATATFERVVRLDPSHGLAVSQLKAVRLAQQEAEQAVAEAAKLIDAGMLADAEAVIARGLTRVAGHVGLQEQQERIGQLRGQVAATLAKADRLADDGRFADAVRAARRAYDHVRGDRSVAQRIAGYRSRGASHRRYLAEGRTARAKGDAVGALGCFQRALAANPACEDSRSAIGELEGVVNQLEQARDAGEQLLARGRPQDAIATWQTARQSLAPSDEDLAVRIERAERRKTDAARMLEQGHAAVAEGELQTALDWFAKVAAIDRTHSGARAGRDVVRTAMARERRRKSVHRGIAGLVALLLLCGAGVGVVVVLNQQALADAGQQIEAALVEEDLDRARLKWEDARDRLLGIRNGLLGPLGVDDDTLIERLEQTRKGMRISEARSAEAAGDYDRALAMYERAGRFGENGIVRVRRLKAEAAWRAALAELRDATGQLAQVNSFAGLGTARMPLGLVHPLLLKVGDGFQRVAERWADLTTQSDTPPDEPWQGLTGAEHELARHLADELARFEQVADALNTLPSRPAGLREALLDRGADHDALGTRLETARTSCTMPDDALWADRYAPLQAELGAWQSLAAACARWHRCVDHHNAAWDALQTRLSVPGEQATAMLGSFERLADDVQDLVAALEIAMRAPGIATTGAADLPARMLAWARTLAERLGTPARPGPLLAQLRELLAMGDAHPLEVHWLVGSATLLAARTGPITRGEFADFAATAYRQPQWWTDFLLPPYEQLSEDALRRVLAQVFQPPPAAPADQPLTQLSRFELLAWMRWRAGAGDTRDGARLPTADELVALLEAGLPPAPHAHGTPLLEWTGSAAPRRTDSQGRPLGIAVRMLAGEPMLAETPGTERHAMCARLVHPIAIAPVLPPELD